MYKAAETERLPLPTTEPYLEVEGGHQLTGQVSLPGAKNAALPAIVAACLSSETVTLTNVPTELNDIKLLIQLLISLGASIDEPEPQTLSCTGTGWHGGLLTDDKASRLRHSLLLLGAARHWGTPLSLPLPGGCSLGSRKHDLHVMALAKLGATVTEGPNGIAIQIDRLPKEALIDFHYPTFGGTLNTLFASAGLHGCTTVIHNPARNPEVFDVIELLREMGANISWEDDRTLTIRGVKALHGTQHRVMSDRIVAATLIAATAVTKGHTLIQNATTQVLEAETHVWRQAGLSLTDYPDGIEVQYHKHLTGADIETRAYPGFHTDIQPLHAAMMILAEGRSSIKETILDGRFRYVPELQKMGANVSVADGDFICVNGAPGQVLHLTGVASLSGATVKATDIRGGGAVAIAALAAEGTSTITNLYQLERGYSNFHDLFAALGAEVTRISN